MVQKYNAVKNVFVFRFQRCLSFQMIESGNGGKIFLTTCNSNVNFIKLQQVCQSQACCNLSFAETWYNLLKQLAASLLRRCFNTAKIKAREASVRFLTQYGVEPGGDTSYI